MKTASRILGILGVAVPFLWTAVVAQRNSTVSQPQAGRLSAVGPARPNRGALVEKPASVIPDAPDGFTVSAYAELDRPRMMVYAPNGDLFVSSPAANTITVLRDANNDGVFEARSVYAGTPPAARAGGAAPQAVTPQPAAARAARPCRSTGGQPGGQWPDPRRLGAGMRGAAGVQQPRPRHVAAPFGLAFHDGYLYVGNTGSLVRYKYSPGDVKAQGEPEKLLDLPAGGHSTRNIVFNRAGTKMYVSVGSQSNNNAGEDCRRAAVLEFNPDGSGYRVYASGIRNPVGLALQPGTDIVWTAVNERDNLGDDLVPDYATSLKDGGFYGWPYSYIGQNYDPRYAGRVSRSRQARDRARRADPGARGRARHHLLHRHAISAALSQRRLRGAARIVEPVGGVGLQGGVLPDEQRPARPARRFHDRLHRQRRLGRRTDPRWGRPVGVTVARDGSLLVSDDGGNRIWKISAGRTGTR